MTDRYWLVAATLVYMASGAWGLFAFATRRPVATPWNNGLIGAGFLFSSTFLYLRGEAIHHCPITNLFEVAAFFTWSLVLTYLAIGPVYRMSILGVFTAPLACALNVIALAVPAIDRPTGRPLLGWIVELHASLIIMGFGMLGVAALAALFYLIQERQIKRRTTGHWFYTLPAMRRLEEVHRLVLTWAFLLFSGGMLCGFFVPNLTALDSVKVAWSAVVWLLYGAVLLLPRLARLSGRKIAWLSVGGYLFVLLTFWGINSLSFRHRLIHADGDRRPPSESIAP